MSLSMLVPPPHSFQVTAKQADNCLGSNSIEDRGNGPWVTLWARMTTEGDFGAHKTWSNPEDVGYEGVNL